MLIESKEDVFSQEKLFYLDTTFQQINTIVFYKINFHLLKTAANKSKKFIKNKNIF